VYVLVRDAVGHWNGRSTKFLEMVTEDIVVDELVYPVAFAGKSGAEEWLAQWTSAVPDAQYEILDIVAAGEFALVEMEVRGTLRGRLGRVDAMGKSFTAHRALIFRFRDGRITRITSFMNGKELAQAVGRWPP
jgi:steroid delta-isomerase-like uncharacterized protein